MSGEFTVYKVNDPRDGSAFYVGCTKSPELRKRAHTYGLKNTAPYERIREIRSEGLKPEFVVVRDGLSKIEAMWEERELMRSLPGLLNKKGGCTLSDVFFPREYGSVEAATQAYIEVHGQESFDRFYGGTW